MSEITKLCKRCGQIKTADQFAKHKQTKDGLNTHCSECQKTSARKWYAENKARVLAEQKSAYAENPEPKKALARNYYSANREKVAQYHREKYQSDPQAMVQRVKEWRVKNPERYRESARRQRMEWRKANPEKARAADKRNAKKNYQSILAKNARRRAKKLGAGGSYTKQDVIRMKSLQKHKCACCRVNLVKFHVDHVVPLAAGGSNDPTNLQILCPPCNISKSARDPLEFMQSRGFLC